MKKEVRILDSPPWAVNNLGWLRCTVAGPGTRVRVTFTPKVTRRRQLSLGGKRRVCMVKTFMIIMQKPGAGADNLAFLLRRFLSLRGTPVLEYVGVNPDTTESSVGRTSLLRGTPLIRWSASEVNKEFPA